MNGLRDIFLHLLLTLLSQNGKVSTYFSNLKKTSLRNSLFNSSELSKEKYYLKMSRYSDLLLKSKKKANMKKYFHFYDYYGNAELSKEDSHIEPFY